MVKGELLHYYGVDPTNICVIHNGVEWEEMQSDFAAWPERRAENARMCDLDPSLFHFLFIGNGYARKGLQQLLFALAQLKERGFHLSVLGRESHLGHYRALAARLNLAKRVTFFGPRLDVRKFYQLADLLLIPSLYDPFANVTVEGLAMGLFVLSSKSNGGHEILNEENGALIPDLFDRDSFAETLRSALEHRKTEARATAIRHSVRHLDFSLQLRTLIDGCL